jgi:hypothetical protein
MVTQRVCRIPITDLRTIRITIKGVATELPLDADRIGEFFTQPRQQITLGVTAREAVREIAGSLLSAQGAVNDDLAIEFVLPADA